MTDRGIPFSGMMVRAIFAGRKTKTRRVIRVASDFFSPDVPISIRVEDLFATFVQEQNGSRLTATTKIPYAVGDRLWIREAWHAPLGFDPRPPKAIPLGTPIFYQADGVPVGAGRYRPGRFMCRWMSRAFCVVEGVKVERLQEIGDEDARAEGVEYRIDGAWGTWNADGTQRCGGSDDPREAFRCLWININGNGAWEANPWVAAYTFRTEKRNIDA